MFERFTERARQVVVFAQEEARDLKHNYIGTEHILLGLLREAEGTAAQVLESLDITLERVREQVVRIVGSSEEVTSGQLPFTPRTKKVLELALREALSLGHNYIGTEHILLGLARENEGVAARILLDFDVDSEKLRNEVIRMLTGPGGRMRSYPDSPRSVSRTSSRLIDSGWLEGLWPVPRDLAEEIRVELGREPDAGDLLLVLSAATGSLPARALEQLKVDGDELWGQIEHLRLQAQQAREQLAKQIEQARIEKERALEAQEFQTAALHRDQERELTEQQRGQTHVSAEALQAIRRRLGLPSPTDPPSASAD